MFSIGLHTHFMLVVIVGRIYEFAYSVIFGDPYILMASHVLHFSCFMLRVYETHTIPTTSATSGVDVSGAM